MKSIGIVVLMMLMSLSGCKPNNVVSISDLERDRQNAVEAGDETAFMATIASDASKDFVDAQRNWIRNANQLGVVDYQMVADQENALGNSANLAGTSGARVIETRTSYRVRDYEERPFVTSQWLTYVQRDGRWLLRSASDADSVGSRSDVDVLSTREAQVFRSTNFVVLASQGRLARAEEVASIAEQARTRLMSAGLGWSGRSVIAIFDNDVEASKVLDTPADTASFVAFVSYRLLPGDQGVGAPRLYVQDENLDRTSTQAQLGTFVHELTHAALSDRATSITPVWLQEGLAEWVRLGQPSSTNPPDVKATLPADTDFQGPDLQTAYKQSAAVVAYMAGRFGVDAPLKFYDEIAKHRSDNGTPAHGVEEAFSATTGQSLQSFVSSLRSS